MPSSYKSFATTKYPTFGRGAYNDKNPPSGVISSPFYWWFKFLQINEEYERALQGKKTNITQQVVSDFGPVRGVSFKDWWKSHAHLFAEPKSAQRLIVASSNKDLPPFNSSEAMVVVIPLDWTNVGLKRHLNKLIDKHVPKTPTGVRVKTSEARYKLGRKWRTDAFKHAYDIYLAKQQSEARVAAGGKKTAWADIAIDVKLPNAKGLKYEADTRTNSDARRVLTIITKRHYKRAEAFVATSATVRFPS